jgi:hypothetical protein
LVSDPFSNTYEYFSCTIAPSLVDEWKSDGSQVIIGQAELYPVWVARYCWARIISGRRLIMFIDNNGSKDAIVKGYSFSTTSDWMVAAIVDQEFVQRSWNWYARVPSSSNPADAPSRLDVSALDDGGKYSRVQFAQPISFRNGQATFKSS